MSEEKNLSEMENLYLALSDKTRLRLLNLMRDEEICVCFFTESLGESQPKISRHLAFLRNAGIVSARRDGKWMHYSIAVPGSEYAAKILRNTLDWLRSREEMRGDYEKLKEICCAVEMPSTIANAPKPEIFDETNMIVEREEIETFLL